LSDVVDAGGRRGQRRTGSQQDDDSEYGTSRPSAPATLFDFVTSKMSSSLGILPFFCFSFLQPSRVFHEVENILTKNPVNCFVTIQ